MAHRQTHRNFDVLQVAIARCAWNPLNKQRNKINQEIKKETEKQRKKEINKERKKERQTETRNKQIYFVRETDQHSARFVVSASTWETTVFI